MLLLDKQSSLFWRSIDEEENYSAFSLYCYILYVILKVKKVLTFLNRHRTVALDTVTL